MTHRFTNCTIDLRGAGYACVSRGDEFEIGHTGEGDRVLIYGDTLDFTGLHILGPVALADRINAAVALECYAMTTERDALMGELARLTAERDAAMAGVVKVKPLVWEPHPFSQSTIEECAIADAPFKQRYQIQRDPWATTYIAMLYPRIPISDSTLWWESKGHADMASARESAQADYDARILATIQPDPEARQADLAKAFCMGRDAAADRYSAGGGLQGDYPMWDFFGDAEKAILALLPPADLAAKIGGE